MKHKFIFILLFISFYSKAQEGRISGTVTSSLDNEPLPFAKIVVYQGGVQKEFLFTDMDGNYAFLLPKGKYDIKASFTGLGDFTYQEVIVSNEKTTRLNIKLNEKADTVIWEQPLTIFCGKMESSILIIDGLKANNYHGILQDCNQEPINFNENKVYINGVKYSKTMFKSIDYSNIQRIDNSSLWGTSSSQGGGVAGEKRR